MLFIGGGIGIVTNCIFKTQTRMYAKCDDSQRLIISVLVVLYTSLVSLEFLTPTTSC